MRSAIATGLVLAGCAFEKGELPPSSPTVTGTLVSRIARNNTDLLPEVVDVPATDSTLRFRFDDGSTVDATIAADGSFSVPRATTGYVVELASGNTVTELREDVAELVLGGVFAGRQAEPVMLTTPIIPPTFPPGASIVIASVGQWTNTTVQQQAMFDWRSAIPTGGFQVGLLESATDRLFVLQYSSDVFAAGQLAVASAASADVDMQDGVAVDLSEESVKPLSPSACVQILARSESVVDRFAEALPPGYSQPGRNWSVGAAPSLETRTQGFISLTGAGTQSLDFIVDAPLADPFPSHVLLATSGALSTRTLTLPGTMNSGSVLDGVFQFHAATRATTCESNPLDLGDTGVPFVESVDIDGVVLVADQQVVAVSRPGEVTVTWTSTEGTADFFDVDLVEVLIEGGQHQFETRRRFRTRSREIRIDESLLVGGHFYMVRIVGVVGQPGASQGNYLDVAYPMSNSFNTSHVFLVE